MWYHVCSQNVPALGGIGIWIWEFRMLKQFKSSAGQGSFIRILDVTRVLEFTTKLIDYSLKGPFEQICLIFKNLFVCFACCFSKCKGSPMKINEHFIQTFLFLGHQGLWFSCDRISLIEYIPLVHDIFT